jgi:hypothetical protein
LAWASGVHDLDGDVEAGVSPKLNDPPAELGCQPGNVDQIIASEFGQLFAVT